MNEYERSPAELEREIEVTRERMSRDIGELGERLSPETLKRQAKEAITGTARRTGFRVMDFIQENPSLVAAMGLGAVWLVQQRNRSEISGDRMSRFAYTGPERRGSGLKGRLADRMEGVREWLHTIRSYDDSKLIAAAELARRNAVYDRAIHTADRTLRLHNYSLRYPMPYQDVFRDYAATHGVDEAWVLGLVRQESRFNTAARSSAGAAGLMQVMPGTARYVAARIGLPAHR